MSANAFTQEHRLRKIGGEPSDGQGRHPSLLELGEVEFECPYDRMHAVDDRFAEYRSAGCCGVQMQWIEVTGQGSEQLLVVQRVCSGPEQRLGRHGGYSGRSFATPLANAPCGGRPSPCSRSQSFLSNSSYPDSVSSDWPHFTGQF